jgi:hypothetical protein
MCHFLVFSYVPTHNGAIAHILVLFFFA